MILVYVCTGVDAAFSSQVMELLELHAAAEPGMRILLLVGLKGRLLPTVSGPATIETRFFRRYPDYPGLSLATVASLARPFRSLRDSGPFVIHARGEAAGYIACRAAGAARVTDWRLLVDARGASVEEVADFDPPPPLLKHAKLAALRAATGVYRRADAISAVSPSLAKYLVSRCQAREASITVNPCVAGRAFVFDETRRLETRGRLGFSADDTVAVFATGGDGSWQEREYIVSALAQKGLKVLLLSRKAVEHPNIVSRFASYDEMPACLSAADVGVVWRREHVVNKVASPIKFSEYLCAGLPVIANRSVDSISDAITTHRCGHLVDRLESLDLDTVQRLRTLDRAELSSLGRRLYGVETVSASYRAIYAAMMEEQAVSLQVPVAPV